MLQPGDHGSTFAGGPVVAAAANAVLDTVADDDFLAAVRGEGRAARDRAARRWGWTCAGIGLMLAFACRRRPRTSSGGRCSSERLVLNATGPDTVRLLPPLTVSEEEIDEAVRRIGRLLALTVLLFAYGSNLAAEEVAARRRASSGRRCSGTTGWRSARRSIRWGGGVVDVVGGAGEQVWGAVYEAPEAALELLDRKEGAGFAYRRRDVEVELDGEAREAMAYEVIDKEPDAPPATPEYAALVLRRRPRARAAGGVARDARGGPAR